MVALSGMAWLASGSTPERGPYGQQVSRATDYLLDHTTDSGFITVEDAESHGPMYGHGFATLFLAEVYGMSPRDDLRDKLQKAIELIVRTQNAEGGWRYQPRKEDADISVTICQVMALRAARNAGLTVPKETIDHCVDYVKRSQNGDGGFRYMLPGGPSGFPRSAAGVVALYSAGIYEGDEVGARARVSRPVCAGRGAGGRAGCRRAFFLRALLRGAGDVARRRRPLATLVPGGPRRARETAEAGRFVGGCDLPRVRNGDGVHHFADAE